MSCLPFFHKGRMWVRVSAQVWNELNDFERFGEALLGMREGFEGFIKGTGK
jgi:hypothetical protein